MAEGEEEEGGEHSRVSCFAVWLCCVTGHIAYHTNKDGCNNHTCWYFRNNTTFKAVYPIPLLMLDTLPHPPEVHAKASKMHQLQLRKSPRWMSDASKHM